MTAGHVHQAGGEASKRRCGQKRLLAVVFCPLRRKGQTAGPAAAVPVRTSLLLTPAKSICLKLAKSRFCAVLLTQKLELITLIFSNIFIKSDNNEGSMCWGHCKAPRNKRPVFTTTRHISPPAPTPDAACCFSVIKNVSPITKSTVQQASRRIECALCALDEGELN